MSIEIDFSKSVVEEIFFFGRKIFVKRDDLVHPDFCGNKARKFLYYLQNDFPNTTKIVSHGSNQSNAMHSLSALAKLKNWEFDYYCDHISDFLVENPSGNYKAALDNGMNFLTREKPIIFDTQELFIKEGGAQIEVKYGLKILADEISMWAKFQNIEKLKIFLPSGTGTTALFLQEFLDFEVVTTPCVGDDNYLKLQFLELQSEENKHPRILRPSKKYHFGNLYNELFELHNTIFEQVKIEFDLLYDPVGWKVLGENLTVFDGCEILYIHQGGLKGNPTMRQRYDRKLQNQTKIKIAK